MIVNRENLIKRLKAVYPFNQAGDDLISYLAEKSEVVFYKAGDMVFMEGSGAKYLYILFEGEIEILKEENHTIIRKNHLYMGDLFGEDVFMETKERQTSARAISDTLLVRINQNTIKALFRKDPQIHSYIKPLIGTYQLLVKSSQNQDLEQETIHYIGQPHKFLLTIKILFSLVFFIIGCAAFIFMARANLISESISHWAMIILASVFTIWFLWNYFEWSNELYYFTNRRVIKKEQGLFLYVTREETPLEAIISLSSQMNILGRYYRFGDLFIKTFTGSLRLKNVMDIAETQHLLEYLIEKCNSNQRLNEKKDFERIMRDRLGLEAGAGLESEPDQNQQISVEEPTRENINFLSRLFGLKRFENNSVIYRTHWIFLLRKTIAPFLVLASLMLVLIFMHTNDIKLIKNQIVLGLFSFAVVFVFFWWLYQFVDWRNDQYIITPEQIIDVYRKPLGREDKGAAPLENIQSVRYKRQGLLGLIFNFGTVLFKVGNEDFTFDHVYNPLEIQQTLFGYLERANLIEKKASLADQQRQIADWMDVYQRYSGQKPDHQ